MRGLSLYRSVMDKTLMLPEDSHLITGFLGEVGNATLG